MTQRRRSLQSEGAYSLYLTGNRSPVVLLVLPAALGPLRGKGVQLRPPPLPLCIIPAVPESLTQLLPGSSGPSCEALG